MLIRDMLVFFIPTSKSIIKHNIIINGGNSINRVSSTALNRMELKIENYSNHIRLLRLTKHHMRLSKGLWSSFDCPQGSITFGVVTYTWMLPTIENLTSTHSFMEIKRYCWNLISSKHLQLAIQLNWNIQTRVKGLFTFWTKITNRWE